MTQREQLMALLESFGLTPAPPDRRHGESPLIVELVAGVGGVEGYHDFFVEWEFKDDGSFKEVAIWE